MCSQNSSETVWEKRHVHFLGIKVKTFPGYQKLTIFGQTRLEYSAAILAKHQWCTSTAHHRGSIWYPAASARHKKPFHPFMCKIFHFYNGTTFKLKLLRFCSPLFTWTASKASLPSATELPSDLCFSSANCKESRSRSRKMGSMLAQDCWRGYKRWLTLHYITKCLTPLTFGKRVHLNQFGTDPAPACFSTVCTGASQ